MKLHSLLAASILALSISPTMALDVSVGGSADVSSFVSAASADVAGSAGLDFSIDASVGKSRAFGPAATRAGANVDGSAHGAATVAAKKVRLSRNLDVVIDLIGTADYDEKTFAAVTHLSGKIYEVSARANANARAALDAAIAAKQAEIAELHSALSANARIQGWLKASGTTVSRVVAVGLAADGSLAVFAR